MEQFETTVSGIPCVCSVTHYYAGTNYYIHSASLEPNDDPEFEFEILDRKGYKANWLENKLTDDDEDRIYSEFLDHLSWLNDDY